MALPNPLRESLTSGKFCYVVELVASRLKREALLLDVASQLARLPGVAAGSITSYAGGALGHDPIRVGTAARARGLTPNIHLTCASRDRFALRKSLEDLNALAIENVFAITGDYPKASDDDASPPVFDLDSVQLVRLIAEMRQTLGMPFWIGVAVSPFKYTEADCAYQYLKLEKKIAAGADYAVTQLGYDVEKFHELKRYLDDRQLPTPVLGNVYVLGPKAAEKMNKGEPPGCWVAPDLLEKIQSESAAPDKGQTLRLERAAQMAAILRGLGYAGVYIGGDHQADHIRWIMKRAEALAPRWEELAEEFSYAPKRAFYLYSSPPTPVKQSLVPQLLDAMGRLFPVNRQGKLRRLLIAIFTSFDRHPAASRALERLEFAIKSPLFGCQACGNCVLGQMEYVCPQTCPKNLRNGPCGGTSMGRCEVVDKPCIWISVYERAKSEQRVAELTTYIPPPNRALKGTSSWINYFLNRDSRPGNTTQAASAVVNQMANQTTAKNAAIISPGEVIATSKSNTQQKTNAENK